MGYMNPFVEWTSPYNWICNLCNFENPLDDHLNDFKSNLNTGSYELIANANYMDRPPMPSTYVFIIDVSLSSLESGLFISVIETIKDIFNNNLMHNQDRTNFAFITFDSSVNFFKFDINNKNKTSDTPQMFCISDEEMFIPVPEDHLLISYDENRDRLLKFLDYIQHVYSFDNPKFGEHKTVRDSNQTLNAIEAGRLVIQKTGGKIILFNSSFGWTKTKFMKSDNAFRNSPKNELIYTVLDPNQQLKQLGINLVNSLISCDIFQISTGKNYTNLLTLNEICSNTNGNFFFYKNFNIELHYKNIFNTIRRIFTKPTGWETLCKIRLSPGLNVKEMYTPVMTRNLDLLIMPVIDGDQTFSFTIENSDEKPLDNGNNFNNDKILCAYIQVALLYTHPEGSRRIRVQNLCVSKCDTVEDYFENVDIESLSLLFTKILINNLFTCKKMDQAHTIFQNNHYEIIIHTISDLIKRNKNKFNFLRLFPMYMIGMIKNRINCLDEISHAMDIDMSNYLRIKLLKLNVDEGINFIYPRMYNLNSISYNEDRQLVISNVSSLSKQSIQKGSIYIIDNGFNLILYVTFNKNEERQTVMGSLLGIEDSKLVDSLTEDNFLYKEYGYGTNEERELKEKIISTVDYLRSTKTLFQNLVVVVEGGALESIVKEILVEDDFCPWFKHSLLEMTRVLN